MNLVNTDVPYVWADTLSALDPNDNNVVRQIWEYGPSQSSKVMQYVRLSFRTKIEASPLTLDPEVDRILVVYVSYTLLHYRALFITFARCIMPSELV